MQLRVENSSRLNSLKKLDMKQLKIAEEKEKKLQLHKQVYDELKFKSMTPQSWEVHTTKNPQAFKPDKDFQRRLVEQYSKKELTRNHVNASQKGTIPTTIMKEIDSIYKTTAQSVL